MAKNQKSEKSAEEVEQDRVEREEEVREANEKDQEAQQTAAEKRAQDQEKVDKGEDPFEGETVHEFDGKPLKGVKAGDLIAPASNPGAAARVPSRPLQPESLQSKGKGILSDKDQANPPYNVSEEEALKVDEGPSGSGSPTNTTAAARNVDKQKERERAEKSTGKQRASDPDNPTLGPATGGDASASLEPIGSRRGRNMGGGSDSGDQA